jgi:hypothetical protein
MSMSCGVEKWTPVGLGMIEDFLDDEEHSTYDNGPRFSELDALLYFSLFGLCY